MSTNPPQRESFFHRLGDWRCFSGLIVAIFCIRGVFVLSVLPLFEGWDEYQHVAYVEFLIENDRPPVIGKDAVPKSLYPALVAYPQPKFAVDQLRSIGAKTYQDFFSSDDPPELLPRERSLNLYQAQHSSFYYRLVAPIYESLKRSGGILAAITGLRYVNLVFGAAAVALALWALGRLVKPGPHRYLLALLIGLQPLFLINCTRVANDALAVLLGTAAIATLLTISPRRYWLTAIAAGIALGLGVLAKMINLALIPFAGFVFLSLAWQKRITVRRAGVGILIVLAAVAAIGFRYFSFNLREFGMLTPMQEAIANREAGRTMSDFAAAAGRIDWWDEIGRRYLRRSLWCGGWTWLTPPGQLARAHEYLIYASMIGACILFNRKWRRRAWLFVEKGAALRISMLSLCVTLGLCYHMLHTSLALPNLATNIWYAAVAFPWLLCLFYQGVAGCPLRRLAWFLALLMLAVYLVTEIHGVLFQMVPAYAGEPWNAISRERLSKLHPNGLGPELTLPALGLTIALVALGLSVWIHALRRERHRVCTRVPDSEKRGSMGVPPV